MKRFSRPILRTVVVILAGCLLNQSQGGMCIYGSLGIRLCVAEETFGLRLQDCPAAAPHLNFAAGQAGEEVADLLLYRGPGPQAQIPGRFLSHPAPDRLIGVEVRAVARQIHQPQVKAGGLQV